MAFLVLAGRNHSKALRVQLRLPLGSNYVPVPSSAVGSSSAFYLFRRIKTRPNKKHSETRTSLN